VDANSLLNNLEFNIYTITMAEHHMFVAPCLAICLGPG